MPSSREKTVKLALQMSSFWQDIACGSKGEHPGRAAQGKDCWSRRWECSGLFLPCQRKQEQGASPGANLRELPGALSAFSAAVSRCKGVQCMGDKFGGHWIPWFVFTFQSSLQVILFQCSKGWKSTMKQLLINSCISKLHRTIIPQRCKHKMILHCVNYFPIWNTESLSNSFKTLIVVKHPVCSINYSQSQLENHCY